jgi:hypothetical protein
LVELTSRKSESAKRPKKKDDSTVGSLALLAASNTQSEMERSDNHFLLIQKMKVATKKAGKWNRLMNLYTKYGDALYELKKKKKEETGTAEIEEIDEELRFLKGKLTKVKKDMEED